MIAWLSIGLAGVIITLGVVWLYGRSSARQGRDAAERERANDDLTRLARMARHLSRPVPSLGDLADRWLRRVPHDERAGDNPPVPGSDNGND